MNLNLGSIQLPVNAATKAFAILAKRGAGKTYTGAVMAEEFYKANIPFVVFDPIDVWWGLRLAANGKDKGLPIVVFGTEHADIPLNREMGRKIAQAVVRENISCVISTFGIPGGKTAERYLISEFAEELLRVVKTPVHVFIEEAHEYVPQRVFGGLGKTFNAVSNLVVMGRNRGIGVTMINQRAATINKDVLTQLDTLFAFQNTSPQDRKALQDWVEYHSAEGDFEKFMKSLPSLQKGKGWVWSPEFLGKFERIEIRKRETFHPDREKIGSKFVMPELSQIDVQTFIAKFTSEIQTTKKEKGKKMPAIEPRIAPPPALVESGEQVIREMKNDYESRLLQKDNEIRKRDAIIENIRKIVGGVSFSSTSVSTELSSNLQYWIEKAGNGGEGKILRFLSERPGNKFSREQIGFAVGLIPSSGSFSTYISNLKRRSLILEENRMLFINPNI